MILKEMMREHCEVYKLNKDSRIIEAAKLMREKRIGSVILVDDADKVVGIVTDRDIAMCLAFGVTTPDSYMGEVMSGDVETIDESMSLFDATRFFRDVDVKRLPVVNSEGQPVGIVSVDDVMALLAREMFDTCSSLEPKLGHMV